MDGAYKGVVLADYQPTYVSLSKYLKRFKISGVYAEITLLTGRVIVRKVATLRKDKVVLASQDDIFGRIHVPFSMIMTISEPVNRVDDDFPTSAEYIEPEMQRSEHLDFSRVVGSIRAAGQVCAAELISGHIINGQVVSFDNEHVLLRSSKHCAATLVSYNGLRSVHGYIPD